jgi:hypothetical protein
MKSKTKIISLAISIAILIVGLIIFNFSYFDGATASGINAASGYLIISVICVAGCIVAGEIKRKVEFWIIGLAVAALTSPVIYWIAYSLIGLGNRDNSYSDYRRLAGWRLCWAGSIVAMIAFIAVNLWLCGKLCGNSKSIPNET